MPAYKNTTLVASRGERESRTTARCMPRTKSLLVTALCGAVVGVLAVRPIVSSIGAAEWSGTSVTVRVEDTYPAAPLERCLLTTGLGSCDSHDTPRWNARMLLTGDPAFPVGSCDALGSVERRDPGWWFGAESAQPREEDFVRLSAANRLYGFDAASDLELSGENRLFPRRESPWSSVGVGAGRVRTVLRSTVDRLARCVTADGSPALVSRRLGTETTEYRFAVYSVQVWLDSEAAEAGDATPLRSHCGSREFVFAVRSYTSMTFGGFDVTSAVAEVPGSGLRADLRGPLLANAALDFAIGLRRGLERAVELGIRALAGDEPWSVNVEVNALHTSVVMSGATDVVFTTGYLYGAGEMRVLVTIFRTDGGSVAMVRPVVEMVLAHYASTTTRAELRSAWRDSVETLGGSWPDEMSGLEFTSEPPFSLVGVDTATVAPTPAPTRTTILDDTDGDTVIVGLRPGLFWTLVGMAVSGVALLACALARYLRRRSSGADVGATEGRRGGRVPSERDSSAHRSTAGVRLLS